MKLRNRIIEFAVAATFLGTTGYVASASNATTDVVAKVAGWYYNATEASALEVDFDKGSALLTDISKGKIQAYAKATRSTPQAKYIVAGWADKDYLTSKDSAGDAELKLSEQRMKAVKSELEIYAKSTTMETYNMAGEESWLSDLVKTDSSMLKNEYKDTWNKTKFEDLVSNLKEEGEPGKVLVYLVKKQ